MSRPARTRAERRDRAGHRPRGADDDARSIHRRGCVAACWRGSRRRLRESACFRALRPGSAPSRSGARPLVVCSSRHRSRRCVRRIAPRSTRPSPTAPAAVRPAPPRRSRRSREPRPRATGALALTDTPFQCRGLPTSSAAAIRASAPRRQPSSMMSSSRRRSAGGEPPDDRPGMPPPIGDPGDQDRAARSRPHPCRTDANAKMTGDGIGLRRADSGAHAETDDRPTWRPRPCVHSGRRPGSVQAPVQHAPASAGAQALNVRIDLTVRSSARERSFRRVRCRCWSPTVKAAASAPAAATPC